MAEASPSPEKAAKKPAPESPPEAKAKKKEQLEDKPFKEFIEQHYLPSLKSALNQAGLTDLELIFGQHPFPVVNAPFWQVIGSWKGGKRCFSLAFPEETISGQKVFTYADNGVKPSIIEPFLIDERKATLDLLVFGVLQRLNAQKWLARN